MSHLELGDCLTVATEAARRAAAVLESWRARFRVREKGRSDLVTEADLAAQQTIRDHLLGHFPDHAFLGEEGDAGQRPPRPDSQPLWIVDPLDGTTNYVHDCPAYCVSIGLESAGELVLGVVFDPRMNELFAAVRGNGATLNGQPLRTSSTARLGDALLASGFPPDLRGQERQLDWWRYFSLQAQALRRTGSTALNLAYVAAGRYDGFWAFDNHPWDVAAGVVLAREAGGVVTAPDGGKYDWYAPPCLASNGPLHPALVEGLRTGLDRSPAE